MKAIRCTWIFLCLTVSLPVSASDSSFDSFVESSFVELLRRDPEWVVIRQVQEEVGLSYPGITPISLPYKLKTLSMYARTLKKLNAYDRGVLSDKQKTDYDYYHWLLSNYISVESHLQFGVNAYSAFRVTNIFYSLPLNNHSDIEGYLNQVEYLSTYYASISNWIDFRAQLGIVDHRELILGLAELFQYWSENPNQDVAYVILDAAIKRMNISEEQRNEWLLRCKSILENQVASARSVVSSKLLALLDRAPENPGYAQYPGGIEYYNNLLSRYVSLRQDALVAHQVGLNALEAIHEEMYSEFELLGYDTSNDLSTLYAMARNDAPVVQKENIIDVFKALLDEALVKSVNLFPAIEYSSVEFVEGYGWSYFPANKNKIAHFTVDTSEDTNLLELPGIVYHEGAPGHHTQFTVTGNLDLPLFRSVTSIDGYQEGWGLYAERLAFEQGWHDDNSYGNLGRLQLEALRAARVVVDTGINLKDWTITQAEEYLSNATGISDRDIDIEIGRSVYTPAQSSSYYLGYELLLQLREAEKDKGNFDIKEFHEKVLQYGVVPFSLLAEQFSNPQ
ncbi:DUF885 family protein [Microbulbifer sp. THAF38]|uniref:DUF885 domain-containing protein n=1 Tax=Microbulbifer sp. THAF38 TaxID=2587856 RepID=UPI0012A8F47E|nr:DUF885 domain-containing protein [Microbulbifer sp. THAF38]QFT54078.1 hypothetical protein FIU95_05815 [Microbulbifer sp. THAF38]